MSYTCLFVNRTGAAAAADSRITIDRAHLDRGRKIFVSKRKKLIFGYAGLYEYGGESFGRSLRILLEDDKIPLNVRIDTASSYLKLQTLRVSSAKNMICRSSLIFCGQDGSDIIAGNIDFRNGTEKRNIYSSPLALALQAGKNSRELTPLRDYLPQSDEDMDSLRKRAEERVRESINKDKELKSRVAGYNDTVGGDINVLSIVWDR